jgi:hypothetical protein
MIMVRVTDVDKYISDNQERTRGGVGGGAAGLQPPRQRHQNQNLKDTDFVAFMISKALYDLPFSQN